MKYFVLSFLLMILSSAQSSQVFEPFVGPWKVGKSNSGIAGPNYSDMKKSLQTIVDNNKTLATLVNIGQTEGGVETFGVLITKKEVIKSKLIVISGATHGNEYLHIADQLITAFLSQTNEEFINFYNRGGAIFVLPILNPDGYKRNMRYNLNWIDLNRDFSNVVRNIERFTQKESMNIAKWVENFLGNNQKANFALSLDYHCCYYGSLLFPWAHTDTPISSSDRADYDVIGELMARHFPGAHYGAVSELLWYLADGTSQDYWYAKYDTLAFTYEGRYGDEPDYLENHVAWWKDIINRL